jgi:hypothetical protein
MARGCIIAGLFQHDGESPASPKSWPGDGSITSGEQQV